MQETLLAEGYRLVDWDSAADIRVVNTCTVTAKSDRTCRHEIRLAKRLDPDSTVVVTGCYAQIDPEAVAAIPGVDLVLGNLDKLRLAEHLAGRAGARPVGRRGAGARRRSGGASPAPRFPSRPTPSIPSSRASSSATSTATPGPSSRSRPAATPTAPTASSRSPGGRRAACPWPTCSREVGPAGRARLPRGGAHRHQPGKLGTRHRRGVGRRSAGGAARAARGTRRRGVGRREPAPGAIGRYRLSSIEPLEVDEALMAVIEARGRPGGAPLPPAPAERQRRRASPHEPALHRRRVPRGGDRAGPALPRRRHRAPTSSSASPARPRPSSRRPSPSSSRRRSPTCTSSATAIVRGRELPR